MEGWNSLTHEGTTSDMNNSKDISNNNIKALCSIVSGETNSQTWYIENTIINFDKYNTNILRNDLFCVV